MSKGYDSDLNVDLLLDIPMREGAGLVTHDWAKPRHEPVTLTGAPAWTQGGVSGKLNFLDFDNTNPDFIEIAAADSADLDFTTESFSLCTWVNLDAIDDYILIMRGLLTTDGWMLSIGNDGTISLCTSQAAADQVTVSSQNLFTVGTWAFVAATRDGNSVRIYKDGRDETAIPVSHTNPLTANRKLLVGVFNNEATFPLNGKLYRPRIWERTLSKDEQKFIYNSERGLFF